MEEKLFLTLVDDNRILSFYRREDNSVYLDQVDEGTHFKQRLEIADPETFINTLRDMGYQEKNA